MEKKKKDSILQRMIDYVLSEGFREGVDSERFTFTVDYKKEVFEPSHSKQNREELFDKK